MWNLCLTEEQLSEQPLCSQGLWAALLPKMLMKPLFNSGKPAPPWAQAAVLSPTLNSGGATS